MIIIISIKCFSIYLIKVFYCLIRFAAIEKANNYAISISRFTF